MGRKLTSFERYQRQQDKERERIRKASAVKARREKARKSKQQELQKSISAAKKEVKKYDEFVDSLSRLHLQLDCKSFVSSFSKQLDFSPRYKAPSEPKPHKFQKSKKVKELEKQVNFSFESYCQFSGNSSFFLLVMLFGTKKKYDEFIELAKDVLEIEKAADEKKKIELEQYNAESIASYQKKMEEYAKSLAEEKLAFKKEEADRLKWIKEVEKGSSSSVEEALELIMPVEYKLDDEYEMDNPTESEVGYKLSAKNLELCVNLPTELTFLPEKGLKMKPSGKGASEYVNSKKVIKETIDRVVCSVAFSYLNSIFSIVKSINKVVLEIGITGVDPKTGGAADVVLLKLKVERGEFEKINILKIDVEEAVKNFEYEQKSFDAKKMIDCEIDRENLIWATEDDDNINVSKHLQTSFRRVLYK